MTVLRVACVQAAIIKLIRGIFVKRRKCSKILLSAGQPIIMFRLRLNPIKMFTTKSYFFLLTFFLVPCITSPHTITKILIDAIKRKLRKIAKPFKNHHKLISLHFSSSQSTSASGTALETASRRLWTVSRSPITPIPSPPSSSCG